MKKLLHLSKFEVGITFIPFLVIILLSGTYKLFFTYFLITFIHELGHICMAVFFKIRVNKVKLSIFGFNAEIDNTEYLAIYKQILIIIMGPCTYFISILLIRQLYIHDLISLVMYYKALTTNKYIFIFNVLPIFPLDGGRLFKVITDSFFTYKTSKIFTYLVSFIFMVLFVIYTSECKQYLMYIFLLVNFIMNIVNLEKEWKIFLIQRYYLKNKYKDKLHKKRDLYMYKNNYILKKDLILNEKEAILEMLNE